MLLEEMGYKPQLQRGLNILGNMALALSDITPDGSLLVITTVVIVTAGTGSVWAYVLGGFIAMSSRSAWASSARCTRSPAASTRSSRASSGGRRLPGAARLHRPGDLPPGQRRLRDRHLLNALYPSITTNWIGAGMMVVVTLVALLDVGFNAFDRVLPALELVVVIVLGSGLRHIHQPLLTHSPARGRRDGARAGRAARHRGAGHGLVLRERLRQRDQLLGGDEGGRPASARPSSSPRRRHRLRVIPFIGVAFGAQDSASCTPRPLSPTSSARVRAHRGDIITWGGILAIFNASLAITLQFARSSGPAAATAPGRAGLHALGWVHPRFSSPGWPR